MSATEKKPSLYRIEVATEVGGFRLCNHGQPCGPRLMKGEPFPFTKPRWWILVTMAEAEAAAEALQRYLDKYEAGELQ